MVSPEGPARWPPAVRPRRSDGGGEQFEDEGGVDAAALSTLRLRSHRFEDAAHAVGHQGASAVGQQVKHHRQELLLNPLVSEG